MRRDCSSQRVSTARNTTNSSKSKSRCTASSTVTTFCGGHRSKSSIMMTTRSSRRGCVWASVSSAAPVAFAGGEPPASTAAPVVAPVPLLAAAASSRSRRDARTDSSSFSKRSRVRVTSPRRSRYSRWSPRRACGSSRRAPPPAGPRPAGPDVRPPRRGAPGEAPARPPGVGHRLGQGTDVLDPARRLAHCVEDGEYDAGDAQRRGRLPDAGAPERRGNNGGDHYRRRREQSLATPAPHPQARLSQLLLGGAYLLVGLPGGRALLADREQHLVDERGPQIRLRVVPRVEGHDGDVLEASLGRCRPSRALR